VKQRFVSLRRALSDPKLLGNALAGDSWLAWRILLIAAVGEALTDSERVIFRKLTGRAREPGKPVHEFVGIIGRRGGKSRAMAVLLCWIAALCNHRSTLAPGETGVALCISRDQRIARIILGYCEGILEDSPHLRGLIQNRTQDTIELANRVNIEVRPCNHKTLRGPTYICIIADEVAHWHTAIDLANPDVEVLASVRPGLMTTRGPLIMVSSAYAQAGVLWAAYRRDYGAEGSSGILVAHGTSRDLNPLLPQAEIDRELERDPVRNRAEYLSEFRNDVEGFIPRWAVEACVGDYRELEPRSGIIYYCFLDSASGSDGGDSYAIAISHRESDGRIIIDAVREVVPPFSPSSVVSNVLVPLCKSYRIDGKIFGDNYAGNFCKELVHKAGLYYDLWPQYKSEIYRDPLLPLLNSKKITLPRIDRLINQTCTLERSVKRSGRDEITHPTHGHDDLINSVAGAAAVAMRAALAEQRVPIVSPYVDWGRPWNWPGSSTNTPAPEGIANTPPPKGYDRPSSAEPWFPYIDKW
jgi:hypothetical protein